VGFACLVVPDGERVDLRGRHGRSLGRYFRELVSRGEVLAQVEHRREEHRREEVLAIVHALQHVRHLEAQGEASPLSTASRTSSQATGVETVGRCFARTEYAHTIDLWAVF
jgi:hypothetical protein